MITVDNLFSSTNNKLCQMYRSQFNVKGKVFFIVYVHALMSKGLSCAIIMTFNQISRS